VGLPQGCIQVCLQASGMFAREAAPFLQEGCSALRTAFGFEGMLLQQARFGGAFGGSPGGSVILW
jgi:hypothetical protein